MTRLIRVELRRLFARRTVRILALLFIGILAVVQVRQAVVSNRDLAGARAKARATFEDQQKFTQLTKEELAREVTQCEAGKERGEVPPDVECDQLFSPPDEEAFFNDPRLSFADELKDGTQGVVFFLLMLGFVVGASFIGAEWHAGTLQALLLWEPRRLRVLLAKAAALVIGLVAFGIVVELLYTGSTWLVAATRGTTEGTTSGLLVSAALLVLRGLGVAAFAALFGFGIAGFARVSAAALGFGFVYFALLENLVRGLKPGWARYLIGENTVAVVENGLDITRGGEEAVSSTVGHVSSTVFHLSGQRGAVTLGLYLAVLLGVFFLTFQRRDVT